MTVQLSKEQIDAIKVELKRYGLNVLPMPGKRGAKVAAQVDHKAAAIERQIARVRKMHFKTAGVKTTVLRSLNLSLRVHEARKRPNLGAVLAMFGVRVKDVQPWAGERWECLRNGLPNGRLALPAPKAPGAIHYEGTWSGPRTAIVCSWMPD